MSAETKRRRVRRWRALARELENDPRFGPDRSQFLCDVGDGWSVRRPFRLEDQRREGELALNCLKDIRVAAPNCYSLRDPDNLPHATFSAWLLPPSITQQLVFGFRPPWIRAMRVVMLAEGRASSQLKPEHAKRLFQLGLSQAAKTLDPCPTDAAGERAAILAALVPGEAQGNVSQILRLAGI